MRVKACPAGLVLFGAVEPLFDEDPEVLRPGGKPQQHSGQIHPHGPAPMADGPPAAAQTHHQRQQHIQPQLVSQTRSSSALYQPFTVRLPSLCVRSGPLFLFCPICTLNFEQRFFILHYTQNGCKIQSIFHCFLAKFYKRREVRHFQPKVFRFNRSSSPCHLSFYPV